jgi:hypothetical protein
LPAGGFAGARGVRKEAFPGGTGLADVNRPLHATSKSFLVLFFKKELLSFP